MHENMGSLLWLAPEVLGGAEYTTRSDVFSFGVIIWEIIARKDPYFDLESTAVVTNLVLNANLRPTIPSNTSEELRNLMHELWAQDPSQRITFLEASKKINVRIH